MARRNNLLAVRAKRRVRQRSPVQQHLWLPGNVANIPDPGSAIVARGYQLATIWAERGMGHHGAVVQHRRDGLSCGRVPNPGRSVRAHGDDVSAVGAEFSVVNRMWAFSCTMCVRPHVGNFRALSQCSGDSNTVDFFRAGNVLVDF